MENKETIYDDPTGTDGLEETSFGPYLSKNILDIYSGDQWTKVSDEFPVVNQEQVDEYIMSFRYNQNIPIKDPNIQSVSIKDDEKKAEVQNYTTIYPKDYLSDSPQMIYFLSGSGSTDKTTYDKRSLSGNTVVIIPVFTDDRSLMIHIELLDSSSDLIKDYYFDNTKRKSLDSIKFTKVADLKTKKKNKGD